MLCLVLFLRPRIVLNFRKIEKKNTYQSMSLIMRKYWLIIILGITVWSCEKLVNDIVLPFEERLVLQSFISPQDTLIEISLTYNTPVIGVIQEGEDRYPVIPNAKVTLSNNAKTVQASYRELQYIENIELTHNDSVVSTYNKKYRYVVSAKDIPIRAGQTYTIEATVGSKTVRASCTVPTKRVASNTVSTFFSTDYDRNNVEYPAVNIRFPDFSNEANYYAIGVFYYESQRVIDPTGKAFNLRQLVNTRQEYMSDYGLENGIMTSQAFLLSVSNTPEVVRRYVDIYVAVTDEPYYLFNTSVDKVRRSGRNPFSEPVLTYTNVENGLGVFAAYNQIKLSSPVYK